MKLKEKRALIKTEQIGGCRGRRVNKMGKGSQKVQTFSYKINKSWECDVQHGDYSSNIVY